MPSEHPRPTCRQSYFGYWTSPGKHIFHRRVWYRGDFSALCAGYARIRRPGTIFTIRLPLYQISFLLSSIAELARGEKSRNQSITESLTHPAYLSCRELKFSLWKMLTYFNKAFIDIRRPVATPVVRPNTAKRDVIDKTGSI